VQLFHNEQHADEGHLTQTRSLYISNKVLCKAAFTTGMVRYMRVVPLSRGDKELEFLPPGMALPADLPHCSVWCTDIMKHPAVCGQDTDSLFERLARDTRTRPVGFKKLADFVEAVIGASYLDAGVQGGIDAIKAFGVWPKYTRAYSYTEGMPRTRKRSPEELEVYPRPFPFRSSSRSRSRSCSFTEMDAELYPNQAGASASASASASSVFVSASVSVSSASAPGFCQDTGVKRTTGDVTDAAAGDATAGDATDAEMTVEEVTVGEEFIAHEMEATHINGAGIPGIPCIAPISGISGIAPAPIPDKYKAYYDLDKLEANLEYTFNDPTLLLLALTHASISGQINNERLEFLGDAVLDLVIVAHVFRRSQSFQPEQLHKEKQLHTNNCNLARVAYQLDLERFIQHESQALSDSFVSYADALKTHKEGAVAVENKTLADAMEAVIGAMFIDSGEDMKVIEAFARCRGLIVD
jgi:dsRNA-specific ribonuclease